MGLRTKGGERGTREEPMTWYSQSNAKEYRRVHDVAVELVKLGAKVWMHFTFATDSRVKSMHRELERQPQVFFCLRN